MRVDVEPGSERRKHLHLPAKEINGQRCRQQGLIRFGTDKASKSFVQSGVVCDDSVSATKQAPILPQLEVLERDGEQRQSTSAYC